jgi:hypothetical protein
MKAPLRPCRDEAEMLAIQALTFIAQEPERLARFVDMTGIEVEQIRTAARDRGFLAGVLDHMLGDEILLIAFAAELGVDPAEIARARGVLGGQRERNVP